VINATVALAALDIAGRRFPQLTGQAIRRGLEQVEWPGRFQILHRRPVVVADGAHNVASVRRVRQTVEALFPDRRRILVFGATADKDLANMITVLVPMANEVILTAADHPRAAAPADLHRRLEEQGFAARQAPTVSSAIAMAWEMAGPDDVICITGSLFVVGDALTAWDEIFERMGGAKAVVGQ
jgi:dihydrofolate synthase/folylpolyglutamate synthase